ncbi:MAG: polysaccharide biosynthesis C-terminal domain-containing protein [Mucilaginibacter sp.]|uniref:lipopolysaccharide biosynthesis protein n=1 Tax=Mucilaginibacter sp. TaxID=1882438 RepID=UPI003262DD25
MNLLKRQGFLNSIVLYTGTAQGFINLILLFQRILTEEQIGYYILLTSLSLLYTQVACMGFTSVITRYLPAFKTADKGHNGFPTFVFLLCLTFFFVISIGFVVFRSSVSSMYSHDKGASLLAKYYYYILPVSFCSMLFLLQETFAKTAYKSVFPSFLREVVLKVSASVGVLLMLWHFLDYEGFIRIFLWTNVAIVLIITYYNYRLKIFRLTPIQQTVKSQTGVLINYGFYSMLSGSSFALIQNLDVIMLKLFGSMAQVGIYGTLFGMAIVISLPAKALSTTSYQIIADAWQNNELQKINKIYHKTSLMQFLIGSLLLIGLIVNWDNILTLLHKPEYANHFLVFLLVGLGFLVDITGGINAAIISFSKYYRVVMVFLICAALLCIILNLIFIPLYGITGAALSYFLTMLLLNFSYWLYLNIKFGFQPFNSKYLLVLFTVAISLVIGLYIPAVANFYLNTFIKSSVTGIVFLSMARYLKISPDINQVFDKWIFRKNTPDK